MLENFSERNAKNFALKFLTGYREFRIYSNISKSFHSVLMSITMSSILKQKIRLT